MSQGHDVIVVVVDRLSKYTCFMPLKHPCTTTSVANSFVNNVVHLHGVPLSIINDHDRIILSTLWKSLFKLSWTSLCFIFSFNYHPQSEGQTDVVNCTLKQYLCCFTFDQPKIWME